MFRRLLRQANLTQFSSLSQNQLVQRRFGKGHPDTAPGRWKSIGWLKRSPQFDRQWSLDRGKLLKGPATPTFPEGVPFTRIRKFYAYSKNAGGKVITGHKKHVKWSLKRGRKLGLNRYLVVKKTRGMT